MSQKAGNHINYKTSHLKQFKSVYGHVNVVVGEQAWIIKQYLNWLIFDSTTSHPESPKILFVANDEQDFRENVNRNACYKMESLDDDIKTKDQNVMVRSVQNNLPCGFFLLEFRIQFFFKFLPKETSNIMFATPTKLLSSKKIIQSVCWRVIAVLFDGTTNKEFAPALEFLAKTHCSYRIICFKDRMEKWISLF